MATTESALRIAAVAKLKAASTAAGQRVYDGRSDPIDPDDETFPYLAVYARRSNATFLGRQPARYDEAITLSVQMAVSSTSGAATAEAAAELALDALDQQVRLALLANPSGTGGWHTNVKHITGFRSDTQAPEHAGSVLLRQRVLEIDVVVEGLYPVTPTPTFNELTTVHVEQTHLRDDGTTPDDPDVTLDITIEQEA